MIVSRKYGRAYTAPWNTISTSILEYVLWGSKSTNVSIKPLPKY